MVDAPERFMSLTIKNPATIALAAELARRQGVSKTAAIHHALSERLLRLIRDHRFVDVQEGTTSGAVKLGRLPLLR